MKPIRPLRYGLIIGLLLALALGAAPARAIPSRVEPAIARAAQPQIAPGDAYWSGLFTRNGLTGSPDDSWYVYALARDDAGNIYAGGQFTLASGVTARRVAKWDGSAWAALGSGIDDGEVNALLWDASGSLYAGGSFDAIGGVSISGLARWDGAGWHPVGNGTNGTVNALAMDPAGNLYVAGDFTQAARAP
jgi:hypothetical protein